MVTAIQSVIRRIA